VRAWLLNTLAVNNMINESYQIKSRILFEQIPSGQNFLKPIVEAMSENRTLLLTYQSFHRPEPNEFEVEPWCVKVFKQRWYLLAKSLYYGTPRIYALDRIVDLDSTENKFKLPKDFDAESFFRQSYGIIINENDKAQRVVIRVMNGQQKYVRTLPWHHSQKEVAKTDAYSDFQFYIRPTFDFEQEILSHGADVEVLEPQWLRDEIGDIAARMNEVYSEAKIG